MKILITVMVIDDGWNYSLVTPSSTLNLAFSDVSFAALAGHILVKGVFPLFFIFLYFRYLHYFPVATPWCQIS